MPSRLAYLVRKARRLASERDRLIEYLAEEWTRALRGQDLSPADLEEFWEGMTEDAARWSGVTTAGRWTAQAWRAEAQDVIARVRAKVEAALGER